MVPCWRPFPREFGLCPRLGWPTWCQRARCLWLLCRDGVPWQNFCLAQVRAGSCRCHCNTFLTNLRYCSSIFILIILYDLLLLNPLWPSRRLYIHLRKQWACSGRKALIYDIKVCRSHDMVTRRGFYVFLEMALSFLGFFWVCDKVWQRMAKAKACLTFSYIGLHVFAYFDPGGLLHPQRFKEYLIQ